MFLRIASPLSTDREMDKRTGRGVSVTRDKTLSMIESSLHNHFRSKMSLFLVQTVDYP